LNLLKPLRYLKGIGEKREQLFNAKGIYTPQDLLFYFPRSFKDYSVVKKIKDAEQEEALCLVTIKTKPSLSYHNKGRSLVKFKICDESDEAQVFFFNMPFISKKIIKGEKIYIFGKAKKQDNIFTFSNPTIETDAEIIKNNPYVPVYPNIFGISQRMIIKVIKTALYDIKDNEDYLKEEFKSEFNLPDIYNAHKSIHFPDTMDKCSLAKKRFSLEELLVFLCMLDDQVDIKKATNVKLKINQIQEKAFFDSMGFTLTSAQKNVISEIKMDHSSGKVMNRLIQGDVGCGKTIVAFYAMYLNFLNGYQSVMMAPTEVLAKQHFNHAKLFFENFGARAALITGSDRKSQRQQTLEALKNGEVHIIFGTHALIYGDIEYKNLNLAITDEQHRFGVSQRAKISYNGNLNMLVMSATPIPRTLALVIYSNMDVSIIDRMPKGRIPIKTHVVNETKRKDMYYYIKSHIKKGRQAYVVCPLIEGEEDQKSVINISKELIDDFGFERCEIIHGKMKQEEKTRVMTDFNSGKIDILVATTVIEVGVNVPNATVMVVEDAHMFGMSTLHQLRGRVGRADIQSYCFLVSESKNERLNVLENETDGFIIAEMDLNQRGPGQFLGFKQHGISDFYMSNMIKDMSLLNEAKEIFDRMKNGEFVNELNMAKKSAIKKYENILKDIALN
jgi:ATP-dependent DNA helicase RecG